MLPLERKFLQRQGLEGHFGDQRLYHIDVPPELVEDLDNEQAVKAFRQALEARASVMLVGSRCTSLKQKHLSLPIVTDKASFFLLPTGSAADTLLRHSVFPVP